MAPMQECLSPRASLQDADMAPVQEFLSPRASLQDVDAQVADKDGAALVVPERAACSGVPFPEGSPHGQCPESPSATQDETTADEWQALRHGGEADAAEASSVPETPLPARSSHHVASATPGHRHCCGNNTHVQLHAAASDAGCAADAVDWSPSGQCPTVETLYPATQLRAVMKGTQAAPHLAASRQSPAGQRGTDRNSSPGDLQQAAGRPSGSRQRDGASHKHCAQQAVRGPVENGSAGEGSQAASGAPSDAHDGWSCSACTLFNGMSARWCEVCGQPCKPPHGTGSAIAGKTWKSRRASLSGTVRRKQPGQSHAAALVQILSIIPFPSSFKSLLADLMCITERGPMRGEVQPGLVPARLKVRWL